MKIDVIYVACYKHDIRLTRALIASVRMWHPDLPIFLIKDLLYGKFDTTEIERLWNVTVLPTAQQRFGWGMGKLEPLFLPIKQRFLVLDSDIVLAGPVLDFLEQYDDDFIVQHEDPTDTFVKSNYFDLEELRKIDDRFVFPGFTFNTGQWVGTSGLLNRSDLDPFIQWGDPPAVRNSNIFKLGEQGVLNYSLMKLAQERRVSLRRVRFMEVANDPPVKVIQLSELAATSPHRFVIHWCGLRKPKIKDMCRSDIIEHFESIYYRRIRFGRVRKRLRAIWLYWLQRSRDFANAIGVRGVFRFVRNRVPR